jgi:hypothetical protein
MPPTEASGPTAPRRALCVEVHDVAPATWDACARIVAMLDAIGRIPLTLLVVPEFHGTVRADRDARFRRAVDARVAQGDEVALHGYSHLDHGPAPRTPPEWFARRMLTRAEGEFSAIDAGDARERIERGLEVMRSAGWQVQGFVPPAWLLSPAARDVIADYPFRYTATRGAIHRLPSWTRERSLTFAYSPDAAWRRAMSRIVATLERAVHPGATLVRLAIHPIDAAYPSVLAAWARLVREFLRTHEPVTKADSLAVLARETRKRS